VPHPASRITSFFLQVEAKPRPIVIILHILYAQQVNNTTQLHVVGRLQRHLSHPGGHLTIGIFHSSMHIQQPRQPVMYIHPRRIPTSNPPF